MIYSVFILRRAQRELSKLPPEAYERVKNAVRSLSEHPKPEERRKLIGRDGWRIRVGDKE